MITIALDAMGGDHAPDVNVKGALSALQSTQNLRLSLVGNTELLRSHFQKYGITEWDLFLGKQQIVVTGYRADGSAARGVQIAWFRETPTVAAHVRLQVFDERVVERVGDGDSNAPGADVQAEGSAWRTLVGGMGNLG